MPLSDTDPASQGAIPLLDLERPADVRTATFALGCFWGPDAWFGRLDGVVRTRVGYGGGTLSEPTYHHLGDHAETVEIDYDPCVLTYEDLVAVFLTSHDPTQPAYSTQYRSAVFYRSGEERAIALGAIERTQVSIGRIHTAVEPFQTFWRAEDYHQKYRLRSHRELMEEFRSIYPVDRDFVDSTAAARVNGWLDAAGDRARLERELPRAGLSQAGQDEVYAYAIPHGRTPRR